VIGVPDALASMFRAAAMQRLERIDEAWNTLVRGLATEDTERGLLRDVHTLKGDAKVVGLSEVSLLCQRLEELLEAAHAKGYRVHDDVDIVVTMTIQFIGMLVRKQSSTRGGIDLDGFLKQIEQVMSEWLRRSSEAPERWLTVGPHLRMKDRDRLTSSSGLRLSSSTTAVFLEQLRNVGDARERIRGVWLSLLEGVLGAHSAPLASIVFGHGSTARELAGDLGKRVHVEVTGEDVAVTPETSNVIGILLVHALRNAIDHGIESPAARALAGKNAVGEIRIRIVREGEMVTMEIADDGAGIDIDRVRKRAVERGILSAELAPAATHEQLLELLFAAGFSTRDESTPISGRGIGLDAAHAAITEHGGTLQIRSRAGGGTTMLADLPDIRGAFEVVCIPGPPGAPRFALPEDATVRRTDAAPNVSLSSVVGIPAPESADNVSIEVISGAKRFVIGAPAMPTVHRALRRCPTPDTDLVEVVWVDGNEVILLRPEMVDAGHIKG
jgi:two-component system chemotaxis sensor kinase CheA